MINFDMSLFEKIFDSFNLEVEPEISELDEIASVFVLKVLYKGSSFSRWFENTNKKEREQAAREILKALKKALEELDEKDNSSTD